jgi:hypothetical protein
VPGDSYVLQRGFIFPELEIFSRLFQFLELLATRGTSAEMLLNFRVFRRDASFIINKLNKAFLKFFTAHDGFSSYGSTYSINL